MLPMGTFAETLKSLRKSRHWNQSDLADEIGVTQATVSRWEKGSEPEQDNLIKLASIFGRSIDDLLGSNALELPFQIRVVGSVEAGAWREAIELPESDQYVIALPRPSASSADRAFGLTVRGTSMNKEYQEGDTLICVRLYDMHRDLRNGDHVIAVRKNGAEIEATCKELVIEDGKPWLWPRSTDPRHQQPIQGFRAEDEFDDCESAEIYAVVIGSFKDRS